MTSSIIATPRLDLIPLSPAFLEASLAGDVAAAEGLLGLTIPADWFDNAGLLQMRLDQLRQDPGLQPWLLRVMALRADKTVIGHIGCHTRPDPDYLRELAPGGVEFGYSVFPPYRRLGYATEACMGLMQWAHNEEGVDRFVLSISPKNEPSLRLAARFGFHRISSHIDEEDGPEDIYLLDIRCNGA